MLKLGLSHLPKIHLDALLIVPYLCKEMNTL